jgi:hypothetical protein
MTFAEELKGSSPISGRRSNDIEAMRALPRRRVPRATISTRSSLFKKEPAQPDPQRVEFLKSELALCFAFLFVAAVKYEVGKKESAEESLANAEEVYSSVLPFVSDPKYSKHLTNEAIKEFTAGLRLLRRRLDGLKGFRK